MSNPSNYGTRANALSEFNDFIGGDDDGPLGRLGSASGEDVKCSSLALPTLPYAASSILPRSLKRAATSEIADLHGSRYKRAHGVALSARKDVDETRALDDGSCERCLINGYHCEFETTSDATSCSKCNSSGASCRPVFPSVIEAFRNAKKVSRIAGEVEGYGRVDTALATPATTGAVLDDPQQKPGTTKAGNFAVGCIGNSDSFASGARSTEGNNEPLHQRQDELGRRQENLEAQVLSIAQFVGQRQENLEAQFQAVAGLDS
ncbi:hypothetical protein B0T26DRAFT_806928 [Lasiosphaeria miniovina]|uniref:Uncharacterized protein n=1 Tax=Lasiosphaeria miniovina TaxID=1954250 RepID=A0AA39ZTA9_9PEZI|nr:uncharacterized protein B0T26DRAFT_806928 [Lasiosphaeria miniovina]KAK0703321.1 hypothetical protein B0T26DRAFT_806928 [Lasiosphaeria miniovina]